jgi:glycosyltransferase involved in cell wall biosynthesis
MNEPKVSVIVPIYNTEKYLRQCLDSIVVQTLRDIEIILINDGSKDGSLAIMKEYAKKDSRVQIIDKPNEGYGKAMNRGLDKAVGEYIGIVESDDWVEPDMFEQLYDLADAHDVCIVKSNYYEYSSANGEKNIKVRILPEWDVGQVINPKERPDIFYVQPAIWTAIYRRDFLNKYKIRFLESPGASYQDTGFNFKVWVMAEEVWLTAKAFVHYRIDNENASTKSMDKVFCICDEWESIEKYMDDYPELKKASYQLRNHVKLGNYKWNLERLEGEKREEFRKRFAAECDEAVRNGGMKLDCFTLQDWLKFQKMLHPKNVWLKIAYVLQKISRVLIKTKIWDGKKRWLIFLGYICVRKIDVRGPVFLERQK